MKTYHLNVKDDEDHQFDVHCHYAHPNKTATELWEDYHAAYNKVIDNLKDFNIVDVLNELEKSGWVKVDIESVEVDY